MEGSTSTESRYEAPSLDRIERYRVAAREKKINTDDSDAVIAQVSSFKLSSPSAGNVMQSWLDSKDRRQAYWYQNNNGAICAFVAAGVIGSLPLLTIGGAMFFSMLLFDEDAMIDTHEKNQNMRASKLLEFAEFRKFIEDRPVAAIVEIATQLWINEDPMAEEIRCPIMGEKLTQYLFGEDGYVYSGETLYTLSTKNGQIQSLGIVKSPFTRTPMVIQRLKQYWPLLAFSLKRMAFILEQDRTLVNDADDPDLGEWLEAARNDILTQAEEILATSRNRRIEFRQLRNAGHPDFQYLTPTIYRGWKKGEKAVEQCDGSTFVDPRIYTGEF